MSATDRNAKRQDPAEGLGPKDESRVREADAPTPSSDTDTAALVELKPCPFCGGEAVLTGSLREPPLNHVICTKCPAATRGLMFRGAVEVWNTRIERLTSPSDTPFQERVAEWMRACFTTEIIADKLERADRFIEESLELVQATGYSAERAHALVDYVFNRPVGEPFQEVGGVMVTLAALCNPHDINMDGAAETELARVWTKIDKIRVKQATKPVGSALPVPSPSDTGLREALPTLIQNAYEEGVEDAVEWADETDRTRDLPNFIDSVARVEMLRALTGGAASTPVEPTAEQTRIKLLEQVVADRGMALAPFAEACANCIDDREKDDASTWEHPVGMDLTIRDFRAAREAMLTTPIEPDYCGIVVDRENTNAD